ncbi:hypothetical protein PR048_023178 [Dryococelus australis]|uniref:Uncharacterized protein n=1 Tax=Dryococelus australis TaxID=614101 RepID=A0ABQ9GTF7_9NEOP|nr:hypothetical protein PR048_023178 [Dryococelus australis]
MTELHRTAPTSSDRDLSFTTKIGKQQPKTPSPRQCFKILPVFTLSANRQQRPLECKGGADPRENPRTSGIFRHYFHLQKLGSDPARGFILVRGEQFNHSATEAPLSIGTLEGTHQLRSSAPREIKRGETLEKWTECSGEGNGSTPMTPPGEQRRRSLESFERLLATRSREPMNVRKEQRRNTVAGETGYPRENPPTSGIVRHDFLLRKSEVTRLRIEPDEQSNHSLSHRGPFRHSPVQSAHTHLTLTLFGDAPVTKSSSRLAGRDLARRISGGRQCDATVSRGLLIRHSSVTPTTFNRLPDPTCLSARGKPRTRGGKKKKTFLERLRRQLAFQIRLHRNALLLFLPSDRFEQWPNGNDEQLRALRTSSPPRAR